MEDRHHPKKGGRDPSSHYDIVIVGAGPVGLMLSTCLARWGYRIKHIDNRAEPTPTGRADGIQPRSLDLLRNMGLKSAIMAHKPARVFEVAFWDPTPSGDASSSEGNVEKGRQAGDGGGAGGEKGIVRTGTWASCPAFIDARYPFTTLLHQGFIERVFLADMARHGVEVQRPWTIRDFRSGSGADPEYPVEVDLAHVDGSAAETVRAKYLFSGEGARSIVRDKLGIRITHKDPISHVWGVMDGVVRTDFPDIKMKCTIHSEHGSIMVIPRENGMVRLYIQLASSTDPDFDPRKTATPEQVQASAKKILRPYWIEWERIEWYSVYPIGQGIAEKYTLDHRVFLGGDACHTHSPKAGQGMNTAFLDAQNLAWKIHAVESGFADRALLHTYEPERRAVAEALLNFDNKYAKLFSQRPPAADEVRAASRNHRHGEAGLSGSSNGGSAATTADNEFVKTFKESCEFTSGYGVAYGPNALNWSSSSRRPRRRRRQQSASNKMVLDYPADTRLRPGHIMANADVTRVVDANAVHLEQQIPLNGAFRIYVFAGRPTAATHAALRDFADHAGRPGSFLTSYLKKGIRNSSSGGEDRIAEAGEGPGGRRGFGGQVGEEGCLTPHSPFYSICTVFAAPRASVEVARDVPGLLAAYRDLIFADDRADRAADGHGHGSVGAAHRKMGFDPDKGGVVVVRPDGYVGVVVRLGEGGGTVDVLNEYFGGFCTKKLGSDLGERDGDGAVDRDADGGDPDAAKARPVRAML